MKIEVGKYYLTRSERKAFVMYRHQKREYPLRVMLFDPPLITFYKKSGRYSIHGKSPLDLVKLIEE